MQTLILDGLSVTAELCNELINDPTYSVRLLSLRDAKNLNQGKLRGSLQYACRTSRPEGSPRLKALYVFGPKEALPTTAPADSASISTEWNQKSQRALSSSLEREGDMWWSKKGRMLHKHVPEEWANCLIACEGIIAFDAVLCQGPRHMNSPIFGKPPMHTQTNPAVADYALPPCEGCGKCPEGMTTPESKRSPISFPLLAPPPIMSSSVRAGITPRPPADTFVPRCQDCIKDRYCKCCHKWWCEQCYIPPNSAAFTHGDNVAIANATGDLEETGNDSLSISNSKPKVRAGLCEECSDTKDTSPSRSIVEVTRV